MPLHSDCSRIITYLSPSYTFFPCDKHTIILRYNNVTFALCDDRISFFGRRTLWHRCNRHCNDVIMSAMASQITSLTVVYSTVYSSTDQRKHQSSASLAFVLWIHRSLVNSPHKSSYAEFFFPFDDVIMDMWMCSALFLQCVLHRIFCAI